MNPWHGFTLVCVLAVSSGCTSTRPTRGIPSGPTDLAGELRGSVTELAERIGERHVWRSNGLEQAAVFIETKLGASGLTVRRQEYRVSGSNYGCPDALVRNIIAEIPGTNRVPQILVLGAHYDSRVGMDRWNAHGPPRPDLKGTPGADDNASGVAALLALAQRFAGQPQGRTLRFVALVNEEPPFFARPAMGSYVCARECREKQEPVVGMLSLEMLGRWSHKPPAVEANPPPASKRNWFYRLVAPVLALPERADYVAFLGSWGSGEFTSQAALAFNRSGTIEARTAVVPVDLLPGRLAWSDDWAFWHHGFDACSVTDTAYLRNADYHEASDTVERLDFPEMAAVVATLEGAVRRLANEPLPTREATRDRNPPPPRPRWR